MKIKNPKEAEKMLDDAFAREDCSSYLEEDVALRCSEIPVGIVENAILSGVKGLNWDAINIGYRERFVHLRAEYNVMKNNPRWVKEGYRINAKFTREAAFLQEEKEHFPEYFRKLTIDEKVEQVVELYGLTWDEALIKFHFAGEL